MTATMPRTYDILGEEFDYDELKDVSNHGANTGWQGFTYSSDLYDKYEKYEDELMDRLDEYGYTVADAFQQHEFDSLQEFKEWACWVYLETEAHRITCDDY